MGIISLRACARARARDTAVITLAACHLWFSFNRLSDSASLLLPADGSSTSRGSVQEGGGW